VTPPEPPADDSPPSERSLRASHDDEPATPAEAEAKPHGDALEHLAGRHPGIEADAEPVLDEPAPTDPSPAGDPLEHLEEAEEPPAPS